MGVSSEDGGKVLGTQWCCKQTVAGCASSLAGGTSPVSTCSSAFVFVCMASRLPGNLSVFIHISQLNCLHSSCGQLTPPGRFHSEQPLAPSVPQLDKWLITVCLGACPHCSVCLCDCPLLVRVGTTLLFFRAFAALEGESVIFMGRIIVWVWV